MDSSSKYCRQYSRKCKKSKGKKGTPSSNKINKKLVLIFGVVLFLKFYSNNNKNRSFLSYRVPKLAISSCKTKRNLQTFPTGGTTLQNMQKRHVNYI